MTEPPPLTDEDRALSAQLESLSLAAQQVGSLPPIESGARSRAPSSTRSSR